MINEIIKLGIAETEAKELINVSKNIKKDIKKLKKGYPIQYLIGYVNFYGNRIYVDKNTLIPRYETETLVEKLLKYIKEYKFKKPNILDLCTGSGAIAISICTKIDCKMTASDNKSGVLKVTKKNIEYNNLDINVIKSNIFEKLSKKYDIIVSNPPYVKQTEKLSNIVMQEPKNALFAKDEGNYFIKKIIRESKEYLNKKSILAMEINNYNSELIYNYAKKYYPTSIIKIEKDLTNRDRYLFIINE